MDEIKTGKKVGTSLWLGNRRHILTVADNDECTRKNTVEVFFRQC